VILSVDKAVVGRKPLRTLHLFVPKKRTETNKRQSASIETHLFVNFREAEAQLLGQVSGFGPTQHVVGAEQAR
jgi:hypothetical protein